MAKRNKYPHWAYPSMRAFRSAKRREGKALMRALDDLRLGCAYAPGGAEAFGNVAKQVSEYVQSLSVKAWGR